MKEEFSGGAEDGLQKEAWMMPIFKIENLSKLHLENPQLHFQNAVLLTVVGSHSDSANLHQQAIDEVTSDGKSKTTIRSKKKLTK